MNRPSPEMDSRAVPLAEVEARIARFEWQVNQAHQAGPSTKDLAQCTIRGTGAPRCPIYPKRLSLDVILHYRDEEVEVRRLCEALVAFLLESIRPWADVGAAAVLLADGWGSQTSLMISLDMWRSFFADHYRRIFQEIHRCGMDVISTAAGTSRQSFQT